MASKNDRTAKRLSKLIERSKLERAGAKEMLELEGKEQFNLDLLSYEDPMIHAAAASAVLRLSADDEADAPLLAAFKAADLDHTNPWHWRRLIAIFAEAHFATSGPGAPKKWSLSEQHLLLADFYEYRKKHPSFSYKRICELLRERPPYSQRYGHLSTESLRKMVRTAEARIRPQVKNFLATNSKLKSVNSIQEFEKLAAAADFTEILNELIDNLVKSYRN